METEPFVKQLFIAKENASQDYFNFNLKLFIARKVTEHTIISSKLSESKFFYVPSLSTKIIIFKGLLMPKDISLYYKDLMDPRVVTRLSLVQGEYFEYMVDYPDLSKEYTFIDDVDYKRL